METLKPKNHESQNKMNVSELDVIEEVDSLLHLYKLAIDGDVWAKPDSIFDHIQDIEYELPPEVEIPVDFEADDFLSEVTNAPDKQVLSDTPVNQNEAESLPAKVSAFLKQHRSLAVITGVTVCAAILLSIAIPKKGSDVQLDTPTHAEQQSNRVESTTEPQTATLENSYQNAVSLMASGKYDEAITIFESLNGYNDSKERISECHYKAASSVLEINHVLHALNRFSKAGNYKDAAEQAAALRKIYVKSLQTQTLSAGRNHTAALKTDGTVVTAGSNEYYQCNVSDWTDIVSISVGETHTVGLKSNGTVVHAGAINYGQRNVTDWWDIIAIDAGRNHTIGLKEDGTVTSAGRGDYGQCDVWSWTDITAISTGAYHTAGLKIDGTVVATGNNTSGQCNVSEWTDMIAIYAADSHTVGLKADGTVSAVGNNTYGQCDTSDWTDIVDIGIGTAFTVGLKADGTVVSVGYPYGNLQDVSNWTDIVDISVGASYVVGLKADGTTLTANYDSYDRDVMSGWSAIKTPD